MSIKKIINESSLSRLWRHNDSHDCGAITAWRKYTGCGEEGSRLYTREEKKKRNLSLLAKLQTLGYSVTSIKGKSVEDNKVVTEDAFFVVNIKDSEDFKDNLQKLGEEFEQETILFAPKGAIQNKSKAYLIGTNNCPGNSTGGVGGIIEFNLAKLGYDSPIYTSYVNGRPFVFEDVGSEIPKTTSFNRLGLNIVAKKHWTQL